MRYVIQRLIDPRMEAIYPQAVDRERDYMAHMTAKKLVELLKPGVIYGVLIEDDEFRRPQSRLGLHGLIELVPERVLERTLDINEAMMMEFRVMGPIEPPDLTDVSTPKLLATAAQELGRRMQCWMNGLSSKIRTEQGGDWI